MSKKMESMVSLRDGTSLATDIYLPSTPGSYPVVLVRTPYGKTQPYCDMVRQGEFWSSLGYVCVVQDCRGKWDSMGTWEPFYYEQEDGWDTLEWITRQKWCNGSVGMTGESYYGLTQWAAAASHHPSLKCIAPGHTASCVPERWVWRNGLLQLSTFVLWALQVEGRYFNQIENPDWEKVQGHLLDNFLPDNSCHYLRQWVLNEADSLYWARRSFHHHLHTLTLPILVWGGWRDIFINGTLSDYAACREAHPGSVHLLLNPDDHEHTCLKANDKELEWPYSAVARFFDSHLKSKTSPTTPSVRYYVLGSDRWEEATTWPPPNILVRRFYLGDDSLTEDACSKGKSFSLPITQGSYIPRNPWRLSECCTASLKELAAHGPLLQSEKLSTPLEIRGNISFSFKTGIQKVVLSLALWRVSELGECLLIVEEAGIYDVADGEALISIGNSAFSVRENERIALQIGLPPFPLYAGTGFENGEVQFLHYSEAFLGLESLSSDSGEITDC